MIPVLYSPSETSFTNMGLGALGEATSCTVTEELNGSYELTLTLPVSSRRFNDITVRSIIYVKPSPYRDAQPFRVYQIDVPIEEVATIHAHHISYDLNGIPLRNGAEYTATTASGAMTSITSASVVNSGFTTWTNMSKSGEFKIDKPKSFRNALGGNDGSVIDVYGGELEFDRFAVKLWEQRGRESDVVVKYGVNMVDFSMQRDLENVYTGVYAYYTDKDDRRVNVLQSVGDAMHPVFLLDSNGKYLVDSDGKYLMVRGTYNYHKILLLDVSGEFDFPPIVSQVKCMGYRYIMKNNLYIPTLSLDVNFARLEEMSEYSGLNALANVDLADYITVEYPTIGLYTKAQIVKTTMDVLNDRYESMTVGDTMVNIADTIARLEREIG